MALEIFGIFLKRKRWSCPWVIDQFWKNEHHSCIWGKGGEILLLMVFSNSWTRPECL